MSGRTSVAPARGRIAGGRRLAGAGLLWASRRHPTARQHSTADLPSRTSSRQIQERPFSSSNGGSAGGGRSHTGHVRPSLWMRACQDVGPLALATHPISFAPLMKARSF